MQCIHCRAINESDDRRCKRCGRRLPAPGAKAAPETYPLAGGPSYARAATASAGMGPITTATAPATAPIPLRMPAQQPKVNQPPIEPSFPEPSPDAAPGPVQGLLFSEVGLGRPKVVSLPTLAPRVPGARRKPPARTTHDAKRENLQQALDFQAPAVPALESVIYCDAPVALPAHRMIAAAVDGAFTAIIAGIFVSLFYAAAGPIDINKTSMLAIGVLLFSVGVFYRLVWAVGGKESPGMRFAGLELVNFEGRPATQSQRIRRQIAYGLSWISASLGIIWALVDEESLTWHDHISKTFPTPKR